MAVSLKDEILFDEEKCNNKTSSINSCEDGESELIDDKSNSFSWCSCSTSSTSIHTDSDESDWSDKSSNSTSTSEEIITHEKSKNEKKNFHELAYKCKSGKEEEEDEIKILSEELEDLFNDESMKKYKTQMNIDSFKSYKTQKLGSLINLKSFDEFLNAYEKESITMTIIIHIFEETNDECKLMNRCLHDLSELYPEIKFYKLNTLSAEMNGNFNSDDLPALLVYKGGQMIGNFVKLTVKLGNNFYADDVENYLVEQGIITDRSYIHSIASNSNTDISSD